MNGLFLSVDGIDGGGKSTQIKLLSNWLTESGVATLVVRDPGGTPLGESLREILLHRKDINLCMQAEMFLYMASRAQMVNDVVLPALSSGKVVIADRFLLANVVYQGSAGGLEPATIWSVGQVATQKLRPDMTLLLDLPAELGLQRIQGPGDRLESRGLDYMQRVRTGFVEQINALGEHGVVIDATSSIEDIHQEIRATVAPLLERFTQASG